MGIQKEVYDFGHSIEAGLKERFEQIDKMAEYNQLKVIHAMQKNKVSAECFNQSSGYGYNDLGRDTLEKVYADVFCAEDALVRPQITCGTHALALALMPNLRPGDELLGAGPLLGGAAEEDHRAVLLLPLEVVLQRDGRGVTARAEQVVAAAVSRTAGRDRLLHGAGRLLAQARQGVVLAQQPDGEASLPVLEGGNKGGGHVGHALFHRKALLLQCGNEGRGRFFLFIGQLGIVPDVPCKLRRLVKLGVDKGFDRLSVHKFLCLLFVDGTRPFFAEGPVYESSPKQSMLWGASAYRAAPYGRLVD